MTVRSSVSADGMAVMGSGGLSNRCTKRLVVGRGTIVSGTGMISCMLVGINFHIVGMNFHIVGRIIW